MFKFHKCTMRFSVKENVVRKLTHINWMVRVKTPLRIGPARDCAPSSLILIGRLCPAGGLYKLIVFRALWLMPYVSLLPKKYTQDVIWWNSYCSNWCLNFNTPKRLPLYNYQEIPSTNLIRLKPRLPRSNFKQIIHSPWRRLMFPPAMYNAFHLV